MPPLHFYADGSGHPDYRQPVEGGDTDHYGLAGVLVTNDQREALELGCDRIVLSFFPDREPRSVEIKASWIIARQNMVEPWAPLPGPRHAEFLDRIRDLLHATKPTLFGQVLNKEGYRLGVRASRPERPATNALRFLLGRLDRHLRRSSETSTITLDEDSPAIMEAQLSLEAAVRTAGDRLGSTASWSAPLSKLERIMPIRHLGSDQSRCLQVADVVGYWLWQAAEYGKAERLRELDVLWAPFEGRREPWTGYPAPERDALIKSSLH